MKQIDAPLPMTTEHLAPLEPVTTPPASRNDLLEIITRLTQEAKMPDGVKNARFVRIPADLYLAAHDVVRRELAGMAELAKEGGQ
jgi:hypothetical protein